MRRAEKACHSFIPDGVAMTFTRLDRAGRGIDSPRLGGEAAAIDDGDSGPAE